jgi:hypothetical protein
MLQEQTKLIAGLTTFADHPGNAIPPVPGIIESNAGGREKTTHYPPPYTTRSLTFPSWYTGI